MENLMVQLLPVASEDGDLSKPPSSAEEYLRRVRLEAQACPDIAVANTKPDIFKNKQTRVISSSSGCIPAPKGFSPSVHWQLKEASNFAILRQKINQQREKLINNVKENQPTLPNPDNEGGWCKLCLGEEAHQLLNVKRGIPNASMDASIGSTSGVRYGIPPLLSMVAAMKQSTVTQVLDFQIGWLQTLGLSPNQGQWLYALLACLQKPLEPNAHSMLRTLARQCAALRASLDSIDDDRLPALNLLITLVARYFDQSDLADNG
ncbi:gem-associated protein 2-like [Anneissia japonica]|uniref:gem-associated protein 2-like n=1 Tax=Anneissia japonica TaxID=1529436 RepID=UPI001425AC23|nr:gem-associated protein 2-like [Anneissia japonica]XP_033105649.1 gem-associated protein 2-like [Anneissia japonica]XP_033105650.1 gem-associated protein 2-like [Anneissia japonica]